MKQYNKSTKNDPHILRILMKQNINVLPKKVKEMFLKIWKIQKHLLNLQIICKISIKVSQSITLAENSMHLKSLTIQLLVYKKFNPPVTELFIRVRKLNICLVFLHNLILLFERSCTLFYYELQQIVFNHPSDTDLRLYKSLQKMHCISDWYYS